MKPNSPWPVRALAAGFFLFAAATAAIADDVTIVGPVTKIELAPDGKSATAVLKDNNTGESHTLTITDDLTLDKFKDKRIVEGDEIRAKVEAADGAKKSKTFRKTAGC